MSRPDTNPSWRSDNGAERRARTREKLISAAARVVSELGETRARIEDFIAAAEVSRGTFYNYYSTREELLDDLWTQFGSEPFHDIQLASRTIEDPAERFGTEARLILDRAARDPTWGWLVYSMSDISKVPEDLLSYPRPDLIIGQRSGRFRFTHLDCANDMVVSVLRRALKSVLERNRPPSYTTEMVELLLRALGLSEEEAKAIATRPSMEPSEQQE